MKMSGFADADYSYEAVTWTKINYGEGGVRASTMPYYSSQERVSPTVSTFSYLFDRIKTFPPEHYNRLEIWAQVILVIHFTPFLLLIY